jgi:hypothetical protein
MEELKKYPTDLLQDMAEKIFDDLKHSSNSFLHCIMNELKDRMTETEYIDFCNNL